jgi:hypothetical protein
MRADFNSFKEAFPTLYENVTCGFDAPLEWEKLLWELSEVIDWHYSGHEALGHYPRCVQVKAKFGGLRFYIEGGDDYVRGAIHLAENLSFNLYNDEKEYNGEQQDD